MTEPDVSPSGDQNESEAPAANESHFTVEPPAVAQPGAGQVVSDETPAPEKDEKVLATYEPDTFLARPDLAITPTGTKVPAGEVEEHIETARKNGVVVFEKEA